MGLGKWNKGHVPVDSGQRGLGTAILTRNERLDYWNYGQIMCIAKSFFPHLPSINYLISGVILQFSSLSLSHTDNPIKLHFTSLAVRPRT